MIFTLICYLEGVEDQLPVLVLFQIFQVQALIKSKKD